MEEDPAEILPARPAEGGAGPDPGELTFVLSEREHSARFERPAFLLTDRLLTPDSGDPTARVEAAAGQT